MVDDERRWTPRQLRTFGAVVLGGLILAVVITALLSTLTGLGAPRSTFVGVLVAIIAMYAAIITLGLRERRSRRP